MALISVPVAGRAATLQPTGSADALLRRLRADMDQACWKAPPRVRAFWCVFFALWALVLVAAAVVGFAKEGGVTVAYTIFLLVVFLPVGFLLIKAALRCGLGRTGVTIGRDAVVVVGPFYTYRVLLSEAATFRPEVLGSKQPTVGLHRVDGGVIPIWALNRNGFRWNFKRLLRELEPVAGELNERLAEAKAKPAS